MTKDEVLTEALECMEAAIKSGDWRVDGACDPTMTIERMKRALEAKDEPDAYGYAKRLSEAIWSKHYKNIAPQWEPLDKLIGVLTQIDNMTAGLISPPQKEVKDEPYGWKLVPIEPTDEMLKAMDKCSTEGYDERLYAGYAASVYMAAVDVAPSPSQQHAKDLAKLGWQYFECPACGSEGAKAFPKSEAKDEPVASLPPTASPDNACYTPPQRKPLTDEEMDAVINGCPKYHGRFSTKDPDGKLNYYELVRAVEAAHGIKG